MDATRIGADLVTLFEMGASGSVDDAELVRRFINGRGDRGSQVAFEAIVERHGGLVRGICRRILRDSHAADDATQSVFLVLARKAGVIRCDGSLAP
jgi:Sigma-70 region 2